MLLFLPFLLLQTLAQRQEGEEIVLSKFSNVANKMEYFSSLCFLAEQKRIRVKNITDTL